MNGRLKARNRGTITIFVASFLLSFFTASVAKPIVSKRPHKVSKVSATQTMRRTEIEDESTYVYNPRGKPDPFSSFIARREAFERKRKRRKPKTYLETLELSQLELIAIIMGPKLKWAMVRDSKGIGHVIKKGTAIGTNGGIVYKILPDRVIIRERQVDFRGREITKDIVKKLHASK